MTQDYENDEFLLGIRDGEWLSNSTINIERFSNRTRFGGFGVWRNNGVKMAKQVEYMICEKREFS